MARERWLKAVPATPFTADGNENGIVTVDDTSCFKVKAFVVIKSDTQDEQRFEVKRVLNIKEMIIGPEGKKITLKSDMSPFLVADNATIEMPEQERRDIPPADYERAVYEEEPTVAKRVVDVNKLGDIYDYDNPKPVTEAGFSLEDRVKSAILCAPDVVRVFTHAEIDGVRRVIKIEYTSASVDVEFEATYKLIRDFTYQTVDPFDLVSIIDTLEVT